MQATYESQTNLSNLLSFDFLSCALSVYIYTWSKIKWWVDHAISRNTDKTYLWL